jgi:hypothetical protein
MAVLTYQRLKEAGACDDQLKLFKRRYGDSVLVTEQAALEAAALFHWEWARRLLDASARAAYNAARASASDASDAYDSALASAWARAFIESEARKAQA